MQDLQHLDAKKRTILAALAVFFVLSIAAATGVFLWDRPGGEPPVGEAVAAEPTATLEPAQAETPPPDAAPVAHVEDEPTAETAPPSQQSRSEDGRFIGYVEDVSRASGRIVVTMDYVQFLTGQEAADAAAAAGEESPPPSGYHVLNENPRLRGFPMAPGATVVASTFGGRLGIGFEETISADDFYDEATGAHAQDLEYALWWVEVSGGEIVEIEQQYVP